MRPVDLAWALAEHLDEYLRPLKRQGFYVLLGSGDADGAIADLVSIAACDRVPLPLMVIDALRLWSSAHFAMGARLSALISGIPIRPEPDLISLRKNTDHLRTTQVYRRHDADRRVDGSPR